MFFQSRGSELDCCPCVLVICKDTEQWQKLSDVLGNSCSLLCDISHKLQPQRLPGARGFIIKQVNETTVSGLIHFTSEYQGIYLG